MMNDCKIDQSNMQTFSKTRASSGDSTQLLYLRARYYSADMGRFLTRDGWDGNANSPLSYNAWMYVVGNPINYTDPSGLIPCSEAQTNRYCILYKEGYIDIEHFNAKKNTADSLIDRELPSKFGVVYGEIPIAGAIGSGAPIYHTELYYTRLPIEGLLDNALAGIALGMIMDFEYGFETMQGDWDFRCVIPWKNLGHCSAFANEDLPSDYLGVVAAAKNWSLETIVSILGGGEQKLNDPENPPDGFWGNPYEAIYCKYGYCPNTTPFNDQCTLKIYDELWGRYRNRPWPVSLRMEPFGFGTYWAKSPSGFAVPLIPTPQDQPQSTPVP